MALATPGGSRQPETCPYCAGKNVREVGMSVGAGGLRWSYQCSGCGEQFLWPPAETKGSGQ